ncbi:236b857e-8fe7-4085-a26e-9ec437c5b109 [Sclerotinia trifoliorum]|uniref:236b857e-8fe7-4085-a26e-9ec437c5b109 n=1 Tax=Sclerotinia trifoliorum TaxID=28548 RepID=A0A8H2VUT7_9HELO|nr:236b857e-8fe7-4085-a26e-9ec437c5b109 [Sclerotinia trifoliorum]
MPVLTEFTLFPKLCIELRAKIWDFASQEPNQVLFDSYRTSQKKKYPKEKANIPISDRDKIFCVRHPKYPTIRRLWAVSRVPAILMTCHESRFWAMKHYSLCFEDQLYQQALWFNPRFDTVTFTDMNACFTFVWGGCYSVGHGPIPLIRNSLVMPLVERLVIQESIHTSWYPRANEMARSFPHLKSLVIRTDNIPFESQFFFEGHNSSGGIELLPSFRFHVQNFWNSDEWKAIRAYDQIPEFQIMPAEMRNIGLLEEKPAQVPPRPSDRIKAIEGARNVKN